MNRDSHCVSDRLAAGKLRGLGAANAIAQEALTDNRVLRELMAALRDSRSVVMARAANALKKVQAGDSRALDPFRRTLLQIAGECTVLEARWNLTLVIGQLSLKGKDRALAVDLLFEALGSPGAFLRTFALQALADLSRDDAELRRRVRPILEAALVDGTPSLRARARKLLAKWQDATR